MSPSAFRLALASALALSATACNKTSATDGGAPPNDAAACTPAPGYDHAVAADPDGTADDGHIAMVLDAVGSPMLAWVTYTHTANTLYFMAYDAATCAWRPRVKVADVGDVDTTRDREVTMARDPSSGRLGIGYQTVDATNGNATTVRLAQSSDGGATWTSEIVAQKTATDPGSVRRPTVAMRDGKTYFAWFQDYLYAAGGSTPSDSSGYVLGSRTGTSGAFQTVNVPAVANAALPGNEPFPASIAIDADGNAGLAYFAIVADKGPDANTLRATYFDSAAARSVAVFDSQTVQNDSPDVSLTFEGDKPRIAAKLERMNDAGNSQVWFSESNDGVTWTPAVELPKDQGDTMGPDISIAANGKGALTIATNRAGGTGERSCGPPKLSTSTDDGATWTTCGPPLAGALDYAGKYVTVAYQPNGKRIAGFGVPGDGVYVWREP